MTRKKSNPSKPSTAGTERSLPDMNSRKADRKPKKAEKDKSDQLRKKAENILEPKLTSHPGSSDDRTRMLIHELQVHQIELEMQNDELRKAQAEIEESRAKYSDLYDFAPVGYFTFDRDGLILEANLTAARELGIERAIIINKPFRTFIIAEDRNTFDRHLRHIFGSETRQTCEIRLKKKSRIDFYAQLESILMDDPDGNNVCRTSVIDISERKKAGEALRKAHDELEITVKERTAELTKANEALSDEIKQRKQAESQVNSTNTLLKLFTKKSSRKEYLDSVVELIRTWSGCCCVGIRILDMWGKIPYESYVGFSKEFLESENSLSVKDHQCACIRVIMEKPERQDISAMTSFGSFRSDNAMKFVGELSEEEQSRFRGVCVSTGFTSVAVIPIRYREHILGAIHIADKKEGMVPFKLVEFLESMAPLIGEAIHKFSTEEELEEHYHHLEELVEDRTSELKKTNEKLQLEKEKAQKYLDIAGVIFKVIDVNQNVLLINKKGCESLGYDENEIIGKNWFDNFVPAWDRERVRSGFLKMVSGEREPIKYFESTILTESGSDRLIAWHNTVLTDGDGNITGTLSSGEDITDRKKAEEELKQLSDELKRSNEDLQEFAYAASHDLQEPLRGIAGFARLLEKRYKGRLDVKADEYIDYIIDDTKRMQMLIKDLLEYSRVSAKGTVFRRTNCSVALEQAIYNLRSAVEESGAGVTYDLLPTVMGDEAQLVRLFQNLIGNAIKFGGPEPVKIHISARRKEDAWIFSVRDTGIGIDPAQAERIFVIFRRLHTRAEYSGTGIGLAICKKIVESHGGQIWVESEPEKGSTFYFTIPDREAAV